MSSQYNHPFTTSPSRLFDSQPQQVKDLLKGLHQGSSKPSNKNTQPTSLQEENMAQWQYGEEKATSRTQSHVDQLSSTGTAADSMYGSKTYGANRYSSETYSQPDFHDASYREMGKNTGGQGYDESSNKMGWAPASQSYYDRPTFRGDTDDQGYQSSMLGGSSGTGGDGYNDSSSRGKGRGYMGQGSNVNTRGRGRGTRGSGSFGSARGRGQGSVGRGSDRSIQGRGRGMRGEGSRVSVRGNGCGTRGEGSRVSVRGKGRGTWGQGMDGGTQGPQGSTQGRGRGTRGRGFHGNTIRGRGSAKRGMPDRGHGDGPAAKKPKWQNEQQGTGNVEHRWGAEQGWARERIWRGKGKEQRGRGGRGRGDRGRPAGIPQRNDPNRQEYDEDAVEYGFDGKLVGPERFAKKYKDYKHCKICDVRINSMTCADAHYSGKIHLKKLKAILQNEELMKTVDLSAGKCEVCDVTYTTPAQIKSHLEGGRHKRNLEEAKAKAEGRPLPTESTDKKKQEGGNESDAAVGSKETSSGEMSSSEHSAPENSQKVDEPVPKAKGEMSHGDSRPLDSTKKHLQGDPTKQNVREGNEKSKKMKRKLPAAEKEAGVKPQLFHCDFCGISTTSPELLEAHFAGKKHKQRMERIESQNSGCTATKANVYSCELCGIRATDSYTLNLHLIGKKHMKKLELSKGATGNKKQLEPLMASASHPPSQHQPPLPEPIKKPPLPQIPPPSEEFFEMEGQEGNDVLQGSGDDMTSSIVQSLRETTSGLPTLNF